MVDIRETDYDLLLRGMKAILRSHLNRLNRDNRNGDPLMTESQNTLTRLFAACWKDEALKARFMSDPKSVLAEHGIEVPAGMTVNVVENTNDTTNIIFPMAPEMSDNLSDQELGIAAGGTGKLQCTGGWGASICEVCTKKC
jgi:hypothetical protein